MDKGMNRRLRGLAVNLALLLGFLGSIWHFPPGAIAGTEPDLPGELRNKNVVLLNFYATWCSTCQTMTSYVDAIRNETTGRVQVVPLDIDKPEAQKYIQRYQVHGVPTYILFNPQGKAVYRMDSHIVPDQLRTHVIQAADHNKLCLKSC
jgi:thioredoxin-like negative regulator of GroEL